MIFRIYALYNQSKVILGVLLFIYIGEVVVSVTAGVIYSRPEATLGVSNSHVTDGSEYIVVVSTTLVTLPPPPGPSVCIVEYYSWDWGRYSVIPVVVLQGVMCLLAVHQSFRQSLQWYQATGRWQLNKYIKHLLHQGILYFTV